MPVESAPGHRQSRAGQRRPDTALTVRTRHHDQQPEGDAPGPLQPFVIASLGVDAGPAARCPGQFRLRYD